MDNHLPIVPAWDHLPATLSWKDKVCLLTYMSLQGLEQQPAPVEHLFEAGVYIREMRLPAGCIVTGREHLHGHAIELIEGSAILFTPDGKRQFDAYATIKSDPGFHAVAYTLTPVICRTLHPNPEESRDVDTLENQWFGPAEPVLERGKFLAATSLNQLQ